ncbi:MULTISPECIES: type II TA system antitoxin MqsA family protein [unclassified Mesorhizobium]|uniref:type II TA system antitoxin MqsA family protein n=1 Tax=unclassified Mesorhizobium TaxID=325217 RepID=UPI00112D8400|nr:MULTISPECIES: type II TA system antitoxin MqsA family protein [unclassified Mesorhizobium]TPJ43339.1 helix-turn-helix domain-containing protein [Mesorhizobium sp. B2-6-6]MBZ9999320.1 type II toxin-antitoxin system MqsA family antitoxin [Mesorhizobium sp. B264B2A]MCA0007400.1 type II toxin-antitoxin system MqsA family antitoxin [Mesorhizobium sp. B264B1B]MCA0020130.1 type II toxin-antitoxin system MqsA family antitoxin [Mesorhizobium sp. B264B1A]TPJ55520.1 helix-turn-helix domain-containing 
MTRLSRMCDSCGAGALSVSYQIEHFSYGAQDDVVTLSANVPVITCAECGESFTGEEAELLRHEAVCRHLQRVTPADIKAIRETYGLTQDQLAEISGFGIASIKRWESGYQIQNLSADRYLRLLRLPPNFRFLQMLEGSSLASKAPVFQTSLSERTIEDAKSFHLSSRSGAREAA